MKVREKIVRNAFNKMNLAEAGITLTLDDLSYEEMKVIEMIQNKKNKLQAKEVKKVEKEMNKAKRGR